MKKYEIKGTDTYYYAKTLKNGLKLIVIEDESTSKKKNYYFTLGTYYGAKMNDFIPSGSKKMEKFPPGIAHFLEHKCFEMENKITPFDFYSKTGSYVNAFTNYKSTCYVVSGNKNLKENLEELLEFVYTPYFTDENVSKEQGIIKEEINMRDDIPDFEAFCTLNKNLYHTYPTKYKISGDVSDIEKITKEMLYKCYNTFYTPSNMFLLIGGKVKKDKILTIVEDKMKDLGLDKKTSSEIKVKEYHEKLAVFKEEETLKRNVKIEKLAIGYKMLRKNFKIVNDVVLDLYLNMILTLNFGSTSDFSQEVRMRHLATECGYSFDDALDIRTFIVEADTLKETEYLELLKEKLENIEVLEEDLERIKKVWISSEVMRTDYMEAMTSNMVNDLVEYNKICDNYIDLIRAMNINTMNEVIKSLDFSNRALVRIVKK